METSSSSILHPGVPGVHLNTVLGPVPSILRFKDMQFIVDPHAHSCVTTMTSSSPHDDFIKTVQSENGKHISRLDSFLGDINIFNFTFFHIPLDGLLQELLVVLGHVTSRSGTEGSGQIRLVGDSSQEHLSGLNDINEGILVAVTESEQSDTEGLNISHIRGIQILEFNGVGFAHENALDVEVLDIRNEIPVITQHRLLSGSLEGQHNGRVILLGQSDCVTFEARSFELDGGTTDQRSSLELRGHSEVVGSILSLANEVGLFSSQGIQGSSSESLESSLVGFFTRETILDVGGVHNGVGSLVLFINSFEFLSSEFVDTLHIFLDDAQVSGVEGFI
mmetsp:Transcript_10698/g.11649  ORF Transcript_10698/g.11649 Transcript_10698/m.11649 type:complete len:335 (-) Transcript_10698:202-1206(-)